MLSYLKISDLALVESAEVEFGTGLNVLSGETGAGKTVLIGAIGLLLGDRAEPLMVRTGASQALLEASFDLSSEPSVVQSLAELGYLEDGDEELTLGRTVPRDGKSRCTVNGRLSPVSALSEIGDLLVEVHGQNTHQALLKQSAHTGYLDRYAGAPHVELLASYRASYARLRSLRGEREKIEGAAIGPMTRELELLAHEIEELEAAAPQAGELEELETQASRLRHAAELWEYATRAAGSISTGEQAPVTARDLLTQASADLARMASLDASLGPLAERSESQALEAEDLAVEIERYRDGLDTDPSRLAEVERRLSVLRELCRKYGGSIASAVDYLESARTRLEELSSVDERRAVIEEEIETATSECAERAAALSASRSEAAGSLARDVMAQMRGLGLVNAAVEVDVRAAKNTHGEEEGATLGPSGSDEVEFLFAPDGREPARPLRKIASGGEMSRVMLALKIVLAEADRLPVLIFDEVDAGIGGETAATVGEKLYELTRYHQVFCVTHLPQIASFADSQYAVSKDSDDGAATTNVVRLAEAERVSEICRMLGDSKGRKATEGHARDILKTAAQKKKAFA